MVLVVASGFDCSVESGKTVDVTCQGSTCTVGEAPVPDPTDLTGAKGTTVDIDPATLTLSRGQNATFTVTVNPGDSTVTDIGFAPSATGGTATGSGTTLKYRAPDEPGIYFVMASSTGDLPARAVARVAVRQVGITVSPGRVKLKGAEKFRFRAIVEGAAHQAVAWTIKEGEGDTNGTISQDGTYLAPDTITPKTIHVRATSAADPYVQATAVVVLSTTDTTAVDIEPSDVSLVPGEPISFHAVVSNTDNQDIVWSLVRREPDDDFGEATLAGNVLVAGPRPTEFLVRATSAEDQSEYAEARVTVEEAPVLLKGIVAPGEGTIIAADERIWITSLSTIGATSREGPGVYRIRAPTTEDWPQTIIAWVDDGSGVFLPTTQRWGSVTLDGPADPEHEEFINIELLTNGPPLGLTIPTIPAGPTPILLPGDASVLVRFAPLGSADWPFDLDGGALLPQSVDEYEVDLATNVGFTTGLQTKTVAATAAPMALFTGLMNGVQYWVRARGVRDGEEGANANAAGPVTVNAPTANYELSTHLQLGSYVPPNGAKALVTTLDTIQSTEAGAFVALSGDLEGNFVLPGVDGALTLVLLVDEDSDGSFAGTEPFVILPKRLFLPNSDVSYPAGLDVPGVASSVDFVVRGKNGSGAYTILTTRTTRATIAHVPNLPGLTIPAPSDLPIGALGSWLLHGVSGLPAQLGVWSNDDVDFILADAAGITRSISLSLPQPPAATTALSASTLTDVTTVSWSNASDTTRVGLEVAVDGPTDARKAVSAMTASTTFTGLAAGAYEVSVAAFDASGNMNETTSTFNVP